jgi:D-sedoheptulose 7-phosphate isomerase
MHYDTTAHHFQLLIEQLSLSVDAIADIAGVAADQIVQTFVNEQKLLCCGIGIDGSSAGLMAALLHKGMSRERPSLPAIELTTATSEPQEGAAHWLCEQLGALGQPGDMAVIFASQLEQSSLEKIQNALTKRQCTAVWIGAQGPGPSLTFPDAEPLTTLSLCQTSAICLAELIDVAMFGPMEATPL